MKTLIAIDRAIDFISKMRFSYQVLLMTGCLLFLNFQVQSQIVFQETFDEPNGSTTGSASGINWSSSCPGCLSGDYWEVRSGVFEGNDTNGEADWLTDSPIDISNCTFIEISFTIQSIGTMEACGTGCNSADWVRFQYDIDGAGWADPGNSSFCSGSCAGINVVASDDVASPITYSTGCIPVSGNGINLKIGVQCWAQAEYWRIDNITVTCSSPDAGTNGSLTTCSSASATNLYTQLGGTPDAGGTWTGPSTLTGGSLGGFDPSTMNPGTYTYTVGTAPCQASANVVVSMSNANAGSNGNMSINCGPTTDDLLPYLGGSPDPGGVWTGPSPIPSNDPDGNFDPLTMSAGTYTYTVGTAPCQASSSVLVTIVNTNDAGSNGTISLCSNAASVNLFNQLGGSPDSGGTWTGPSALTGGDLGTFDPATMNAGVYTYTVGTSPCAVSATVSVTVTSLGDAGSNGTISLCSNAASVNLFNQLGGSPDSGGTWTGPSVLTGGDLGTFDPATMNAGVYTYTVGTSPCAVSATVSVTVTSLGDAGSNGTISLCSNAVSVNLFSQLGGSPDSGGTWTGPSALTGGDLGTFDPATMNAGVYTYTVGTSPCAVSATVSVTVTSLGDAGSNGTISLCSNAASVNLFNQLGGSPDSGGTWTGPSVLTGGDLGAFDPATMNAGVYTYTVGTSPCISSATVTVTILGNIALTIENDTICAGETGVLNAIPSVSGGTFSWSPSGTNTGTNSYAPVATTTYTVTYTIGGTCSVTESADIVVLPAPIAFGDPTSLFGQAPLGVTIDNLSSGATQFQWDFGNGTNYTTATNESVTAVYTTEGTYTLQLIASNGLCQNVWSEMVIVIASDPLVIEIPNVFSPNHDNTNDTYQLSIENAASIQATIVNRWGNVVAEYNDLNFYWDGTVNGNEASEGTYFIIYEIVGLDGTIQKGQSFFELVR